MQSDISDLSDISDIKSYTMEKFLDFKGEKINVKKKNGISIKYDVDIGSYGRL